MSSSSWLQDAPEITLKISVKTLTGKTIDLAFTRENVNSLDAAAAKITISDVKDAIQEKEGVIMRFLRKVMEQR